MKLSNFHSRSRGFSLIEVLVAVVVLSVGLLALALLQVSLVRSSSSTNSQSVALSLAKDKLEDLRTYTNMAGYRALTDSGSAESLAVGGLNYSRTWTVARYANPNGGGDFASIADTGATPNGYKADNEFKTVAVSVAWTDASNATQTVTVADAIGAIDPTDSAKLAKPQKSIRPRGPEVILVNPESVSGVIPIALGNGSDTAATNPRPIIVSQGNSSSVVETRFDVLTYLALNSDTALGQLRVETAVVGCQCTATAAANVGFRPTYWNGARYAVPTEYTYTTKSLEKSGVTQSDRCVACCRDHRDPSAVSAVAANPLFDRRRTDGHRHFNTDLATEVTTGTYREACRMIRVDGFWRTAADLYDDYFGVLATGSNNDATAPSAAMADNYEAFVLDYLNARYVAGPTSNFNSPSSYTSTITARETARNLNDPVTPVSIDPASTTPKWTHSRGLYVDYLEQEAKDLIEGAKTTCGSTNACILKYASFTSINLSEIADWQATNSTSPFANNTVNIQVSNNSFATSVSDLNPVRGKVLPGSAPVAGSSGNSKSLLTASNSGVALFQPVDNDTDSTVLSDSQTFSISNGAPPPPVGGGSFGVTMSGVISPPVDSGTSANPPKVTFTISAIPVDCSANGTLVLPYTCTTTTGQALGAAVAFQISNYNRQLDATTGVTLDNACRNNGTTKMPYRIIMDAIAGTSTNLGAVVSAPVVFNPDAVGLPAVNGEYTTFTVTPVAAPISPATVSLDTITVNMANKSYRCPTNWTTYITNAGAKTSLSNTQKNDIAICPGSGSNTAPAWASTYGACPTGFSPFNGL